MYDMYPYFTNDGSVGLYSFDVNDIYHSTYGALTEAYEKFILPADLTSFLKKNNEIKILDICFGIGYNTKSLLNFILDFKYNEQIYTDNHTYIDKVYTDNKKLKVFIKAIDIDKNLAYLSPFFITSKNNIKNNKLDFKQAKIEKMLKCEKSQKFVLKKEVNILLIKNILDKIDNEAICILKDPKYALYFDKEMIGLFWYLINRYNKKCIELNFFTFLHNIYYRYISNGYKNVSKWLKMNDFIFDLNIDDARKILLSDNNTYDFIFLDAFTPAKCPCLWTVDFFRLLFEHLNLDGMILTYSNSATVRNAFLHAGFYVGKIYTESSGKFTGTVAVKNKSLIKYELSEYDLSLLKTKAGIFYRDENLNAINEAIIERHKIEVKNSNLISSSQFIKEWKRLH